MKSKDKRKKLRFFQSNDHDQQRTFFHVVIFFFVMVLLTLIARGSASGRLARVSVVTPSARNLSQSVQFFGTAKPVGNHFSSVPAGLTISQVRKEAMDKIVKGDVIAVVDQAALDELVIRERAKLRQMEIQLESQLKWSDVSDRDLTAAQKNYDREQERYDRLQADEESTPEDIMAAMEQLEAARIAVDLAQEAYKEEVLLEEPSARTLMLDIAAAQTRVDELIQVQAQQYQILAETGGVLSDQPLTKDSVTTGAERIGIATPVSGLTLTFQASQEDARSLIRYEPQLTATLEEELEEKLRSYSFDVNTLDQPMVTFTATLRDSAWLDRNIAITGELWEDSYGICIPMSALRQDSEGYFVYVMQTTQTLMGIDKRVVRVGVHIEQTDGFYAAISGGLSGNEKVILSSSKPLSDGDSVRVGP